MIVDKNKVRFQDIGLISYGNAWDYQEKLFNEVVEIKRSNKSGSTLTPSSHHLIFCEHHPVFTLGKSGDNDNLLVNEEHLKKLGIEFFKVNRGGDITYHGPGQIVGYPILDLDEFFTDIHKYLRFLEEVIIRTLAEYELTAGRLNGSTGVWLDPENPFMARKICAMGVRCSRWVTMHGFAFNVNTNLDHFNYIVPCGIDDKQVTSMQKELGKEVNIEEVKSRLKFHFEDIFQASLVDKAPVNELI